MLDLPVCECAVGDSVSLRLKPHPGAIDFPAYFRALAYEPEVFLALGPRLHKYDLIVEIGANVGLFTVYFAKKFMMSGKKGKILAFEPASDAFRMLLENVRLNDLDNVVLLSCAVDAKVGLIDFFQMPDGEPTSSLNYEHAMWHQHVTGKKARKCTVAAINGDVISEFAGSAENILIKIDAERAEASILRGMEDFIRQRRPEILLEVLKGDENALNELAFLQQMYRFYRVGPQGLVETSDFWADETYLNRDYLLLPGKSEGGT